MSENATGQLEKGFRNQYLEAAIVIATEAGKIILKHFQGETQVLAQKDDQSPLTLADWEAHQHITERLASLAPSIPIISEEGDPPDYEVRREWTRFWLVDPLDGTKEFLSGNDEFTVNIALLEKQEPILGVVYAPAKQLLYYAAKGEGTWKKEGDTAPVRIFSSPSDRSQPLIVVESKSHPSSKLEEFLKDLPVKERISAGSSLKFCLVAEGLADLYPRMNPTMEWDVAAGDCIYRNSASVGQHDSPLTYNKSSLRNESFVIGLQTERQESNL
jgi:3'(2'), 5'-bisphosphate nucleotidase